METGETNMATNGELPVFCFVKITSRDQKDNNC